MSLRVKRSNLAVPDEIATHLSGARNDVDIIGLYLFIAGSWYILTHLNVAGFTIFADVS